jgi:hypothetical protein
MQADNLTLRIACGLQHPVFQVAPDVFYVPGTDQILAFGPGPQPATVHLRALLADAVGHRLPDAGPGRAAPCAAPVAELPR